MGIKKDKWKAEWNQWKYIMGREVYLLKEELKDEGPAALGHYYVDLYVESMRHAPYLWGHVAAITTPIVIGVAIYGWLV